jgi:glutathione S-transferase
MYKLFHFPLCPFSRKVRFLLSYFNIPSVLVEEKFWERREGFLRLSPIGTVPLMVKKNGLIMPHSGLISDYILKNYAKKGELMPTEESESMKVKSVAIWFDEKFFNEVSRILLYEKVIHVLKQDEMPDVNALSASRYNLQIHLEFMEFMLSNHQFLAGEFFTLADVVGACHISVLDYLAEIKWNTTSPLIKEWYGIVKSKLAFKEILSDKIPNIKPSITYETLDF